MNLLSAKKQIGLFFGSFNPIHNGHLIIAGYILEFSELDELWLVVSPHNPLKHEETLAPDQLRLEMVKHAIPKANNRIHVCDIEMDLPRPSFTINTLNMLSAKYPDYEFVVIMGSDSMANIYKWKEYLKLISSYKIMVYPRKGFKANNQKLSKNIRLIDAPVVELSSTLIRSAVRDRKDISFFVPKEVVKIIKDNKLYI